MKNLYKAAYYSVPPTDEICRRMKRESITGHSDLVVKSIIYPCAAVANRMMYEMLNNEQGLPDFKCGDCGEHVYKHFRFCPSCGNRITENNIKPINPNHANLTVSEAGLSEQQEQGVLGAGKRA